MFNLIRDWKFWLFVVVLIFVILSMGCVSGQKIPIELATKPAERLAEAVGSAKNLTWMFIVAAAVSAMALFNGSKSAAGWIAASLFGLGLSIAVAKYAEIIALTCLIGSGIWFFRSTLKRTGWLFNWTIRKKVKK